MLIRWNVGDNSYCFLVLPIFMYLCWEKKSFQFKKLTWSTLGMIPAIVSVFIIATGELGSMESLLFIGIWGCITSLVIILYGLKRSLSIWFPILILAFIVPLPPFINNILTFEMKMAASSIAVEMMRVIGMSVLKHGNIIDLGIAQLQVVDACSGLRYIVSMVLMALLIGHFFVTGWWRKLILLMFVYPLSIVLNAVRIFITGLLTINGYQNMIQGVFHDMAGLMAFLAAGFIFLVIAKLSMRVGNINPRAEKIDKGADPVSKRKVIFLSLSLSLLFISSGWALHSFRSVLSIPKRNQFDSFPMEINDWKGKKSYFSKEIMDSLWADDYVNATFTRPGTSNSIFLLIPYYKYQGTRHTAHAPHSCLLGSGWSIADNGQITVDVGDRKLDIGIMHFQKGNMNMLASYFFLQRGRVIVSPLWNKFYLLMDALKLRRTDGALVRVEILTNSENGLDGAGTQLKAFIKDLWPLLSKYVPN